MAVQREHFFPTAVFNGKQHTMKLDHQDILNLPKIPRLNLINSMVGFKSANLVSTIDPSGTPNLAIFSSIIHMGSNPPLVGFVTRPLSVERHTYNNIKQTGFYTINSIQQGMIERAHQTSAKYEAQENEFEMCQFEEQTGDKLPVPYVAESSIKIGLSYVEEHHIKANDTILVIGQIEELIIPEGSMQDDGFVDLSNYEVVTISGLDSYLLPSKITRLRYARKNEKVAPL